MDHDRYTANLTALDHCRASCFRTLHPICGDYMPHCRPVTHHTASAPGGLLKWPPSVVVGNCTKGAESCGGAHYLVGRAGKVRVIVIIKLSCNSGYSRNNYIMQLIHTLAAEWDSHVVAGHVPGIRNLVSDTISQWHAYSA